MTFQFSRESCNMIQWLEVNAGQIQTGNKVSFFNSEARARKKAIARTEQRGESNYQRQLDGTPNLSIVPMKINFMVKRQSSRPEKKESEAIHFNRGCGQGEGLMSGEITRGPL
ncbi:unnamed protein product [Natator depressus]